MTFLRFLLVLMAATLTVYTVMAIGNEGINLFANTIPAIADFGWQGQFHLDFVTYLVLSGLWIAWRHDFSGSGIAFGIAASTIGIMFFAIYVFVASYQAEGDLSVVLLGEKRSTG